MNEELVALIEDQINKELWSGYLYYGVAEYYRAKGLDGFHAWFMKHAIEETEHAEKFCEYLQDRGISFKFKPIEPLTRTFNDIREPLEFQVEHEKVVTGLINNIYALANKLDDVLTKNFIQWFITEQLEEEKTAKDLLEHYDLFCKDSPSGLYHFDKDLKA